MPRLSHPGRRRFPRLVVAWRLVPRLRISALRQRGRGVTTRPWIPRSLPTWRDKRHTSTSCRTCQPKSRPGDCRGGCPRPRTSSLYSESEDHLTSAEALIRRRHRVTIAVATRPVGVLASSSKHFSGGTSAVRPGNPELLHSRLPDRVEMGIRPTIRGRVRQPDSLGLNTLPGTGPCPRHSEVGGQTGGSASFVCC